MTGFVVVTRRSPTVPMLVIVTMPPVARPMTSCPLVPADVNADVRTVLFAAVIVVVVPRVPTFAMIGFAARVGETVAAEVIVGVSRPPLLLMTAAGELAAADVVAFVATVFAATVGDTEAAAVVGVVMRPDVIALVAPLRLAVVATPPLMPAPPPPLVMTGVGGELIDEFTVISGFA